MCKYHIVFIPKYRRKIIYNKLKRDIQGYIVDLCKWKGVEINLRYKFENSNFWATGYYVSTVGLN